MVWPNSAYPTTINVGFTPSIQWLIIFFRFHKLPVGLWGWGYHIFRHTKRMIGYVRLCPHEKTHDIHTLLVGYTGYTISTSIFPLSNPIIRHVSMPMRSQETVQAQKNLEGCGVPGAEGFLDQLCRSESFDSLLRLWPNCWERGKGKITLGWGCPVRFRDPEKCSV